MKNWDASKGLSGMTLSFTQCLRAITRAWGCWTSPRETRQVRSSASPLHERWPGGQRRGSPLMIYFDGDLDGVVYVINDIWDDRWG